MEEIKQRLHDYYQEYNKLQYLDLEGNLELNQLIVDNFNNLIIPHIGTIVELLDEFIREYLAKAPNNYEILNWVDIISNSHIYDLVINTMKNNLNNLDEEDKLIHYIIIKIEMIKLKIYSELFEKNQSNDKLVIVLNYKIKESKEMISYYYSDLVDNYKEFTKAIELVNQLFSQVEK
jgi:hypothetical protein